MDTRNDEHTLSVDQLQTGIFICLEEHWLKHPFLLNNFKIKNGKQLEILRQLGIDEFRYDPDKSDRPPLPVQEESEVPPTSPKKQPVLDGEFVHKQQRKQELQNIRKRIVKTAKKFNQTAEKVPNLMSNLMSGSEGSLAEVHEVVREMVETFVSVSDTVMHLMDAEDKDQELTYHFLNVSVLAMMLGSALELDAEQLQTLGMGALMHDLGKMRIEKKHWRKPREAMNKHEQELLRLHPRYGVEMAAKAGVSDKNVLATIMHHHERSDGFGYPNGLKGREIALPGKITTIANIFDTLCNHYDPSQRLSPYATLQLMFKRYDTIIDMSLFAFFVKRLGVYPPGTIVTLTSGAKAKVMAVNPSHPLKPMVMPYVSGISSKDALVLDLTEEDQNITKAVDMDDLSSSELRYLKPQARISYFMEELDAES
ncbi:HD-GYP domain-containing protein [Desulfoplanes sp.]